MADRSHNRIGQLCLVSLGGLLVLAGCGPKNYKKDADEKVYKFVDSQWEPEFGPRANYRITGAPPAPNDIDDEQVARVEKTVAETGVLTIPQAALLATAHNRDYHLQKELLYTMALDMRLVRHFYETQLFGGGTVLYANDERQGVRQEEVVAEPNLGFNRLLAIGTLVGAQVGARWINVLTGSGDSGLSAIFSASAVQPLLRGSDPRVVREPLTQAEHLALQQIRTVSRFRKIVLVAAVTQYYETLELQDQVWNAEAHVNSLLTLESRVRKLVEAGLLPKEEWLQVRQEILRAQDTQILAQKEYESFLDLYKTTILSVPPTREFRLETRVFEALKAHGIPYPDISLNEALETALCRRLDLTNNAEMVLDAQRAAFAAKDALRTGLNVFAATDLDSNGPKNTVAGVTLDLPLDRVPEQDLYARALVLLNQRQREYELTADTIRMEVREAHRTLLEAAKRYQNLSAQLRLAEERVEHTFSLLQYARLSSRRVLTALEHLRDARNESADALTDYMTATLNFYRDTEVLQVRPDGMWQENLKIPMPSIRTTANTLMRTR